MLQFTALPAPLVVDQDKSMSMMVDEENSYPCRRCLEDGHLGEEILLVSYDPFLAASPYTGPGPVFVHRKDCTPYKCDGSVPGQQSRRLLSVRAYDVNHLMVECDVVEGKDLAEKAESFFASANVKYLHAHYARPGCFAVRIDKA